MSLFVKSGRDIDINKNVFNNIKIDIDNFKKLYIIYLNINKRYEIYHDLRRKLCFLIRHPMSA